MTWQEWAASELEGIAASGRLRHLRSFDALGPEGTLEDGRKMVSFASNDYLGLTAHPAVAAGAREALARWGTGSGASRLITGTRPVHGRLEEELADWKGCQAALVFPTGFAANLGVLTALGGPDVTILSDELNHASIIDGTRLARARVEIYRHADVEHLASLLPATGRAMVVTDSVFSMDGDQAPLDEIAALCAARGALLVIDEAHAVLGHPADLGGAEVVRVGTLSKTLGALGGYAAGTRSLVDLLVNRARPFIFTTAPTPADTGAALAALQVLNGPEGRQLLAHLRHLVDLLRPGHPSPIVPVLLGSERAALAAADALLARGLLVPAIRPPTVPDGTSRLRVALSAAHTVDQVETLRAALAEVAAPA